MVKRWYVAATTLCITLAQATRAVEPIETVSISFQPYALVFAPDGATLAMVGYDEAVHLVDTATWKETRKLKWTSDVTERSFGTVAFAPDGSKIAIGGDLGSVCLWSLKDDRELKRWVTRNSTKINCLQFSADGNILLAAARDDKFDDLEYEGGSLHRFDVEKFEEIKPLAKRDAAPHNFIARLRSGDLFIGSRDGTALKWDLTKDTGKALNTATGDISCQTWAVAPDESEFIAGNHAKLDIRAMADGKLRATLEGHKGYVLRDCYSPNGKLVASTGEDKTIRVWDPATGKQLKALDVPADRILGLVFSPKGDLLISAGYDKKLRVWRVKDLTD